MSYGAGRGVNVSQYLRNLNVQESPVEETFITDEELAKDLALFTNTQFYDFETGQHTDYQAPPVKPEVTQSSPAEDVTSTTDPIMGEFPPGFDFMSGDFSFGDFSSTYTSPTVQAFPDALGNLQPIQPNPQQSAYPAPPSAANHGHGHHHHAAHPQHHPHHPAYAAGPPRIGSVSGPSSSSAAAAAAGEKRNAPLHEQEPMSPSISPPNGRVLSFEDASRMAAEEDKRKRNTAASARFRIKKKQREQALEKNAREMGEKVTMLEGRISALETENKWLKSLVTEKHGGREEILEKLLKEFAGQAQEGGESKKRKGAAAAEGEVRDSIHAANGSDEKNSKRKD